MSRTFRVAVAGATGLVGGKLLEFLERREFPFSDIVLYGSPASEGRVLHVRGRPCRLQALGASIPGGFDAVFLAASPGVARRFAPAFAEAGAVVVDTSGDWRLDPAVPLVVPELQPPPRNRPAIVASPSPAAVLLSLATRAIREAAGIRRGWVLAHLPVSSGGRKALEEFEDDLRKHGMCPDPAGAVSFTGRYHGEESGGDEVAREVLKILGGEAVPLDVSCFRVPVARGVEAIAFFEMGGATSVEEITNRLRRIPGVHVGEGGTAAEEGAVRVDSCRSLRGPSPAVSLRLSCDNLAKGSALNAVQIAEAVLLGS